MHAYHEAVACAIVWLPCVLALVTTATGVFIYLHLQLASRLAAADAEHKKRFDQLDESRNKLERLMSRLLDTLENPESTRVGPCGSSKVSSQMKRQKTFSESTKPKQCTVNEALGMLNCDRDLKTSQILQPTRQKAAEQSPSAGLPPSPNKGKLAFYTRTHSSSSQEIWDKRSSFGSSSRASSGSSSRSAGSIPQASRVPQVSSGAAFYSRVISQQSSNRSVLVGRP